MSKVEAQFRHVKPGTPAGNALTAELGQAYLEGPSGDGGAAGIKAVRPSVQGNALATTVSPHVPPEAERGLGSSKGHQFAAEVLEGGSGQALAGHGVMEGNTVHLGTDRFVASPGTTVITPRPGIGIKDSTGQILENVTSVEHLREILRTGIGPNGEPLSPVNYANLKDYQVILPGETGYNFIESLSSVPPTTVAELSPGELLRQKYGHLSTQERQALIQQKVESNAENWVRNFEADLNTNYLGLNAHFVDKHGPDIPLKPNLEQRAIDGSHPRTGDVPTRPRGQTSSQFQDWRTQMEVINEATTREARGLPKYNFFDAQGNPAVIGNNPAGVGWGFTPNRASPATPVFNPQLNGWIIRFDPNLGVPFTGYPKK